MTLDNLVKANILSHDIDDVETLMKELSKPGDNINFFMLNKALNILGGTSKESVEAIKNKTISELELRHQNLLKQFSEL